MLCSSSPVHPTSRHVEFTFTSWQSRRDVSRTRAFLLIVHRAPPRQQLIPLASPQSDSLFQTSPYAVHSHSAPHCQTPSVLYKGKSMGQNMSHQRGRGGPVHDQLDYNGAASESYDPETPRLRGGDASRYPKGGAGSSWFVDASANVGKGGYGRLSPPPTDDDFYEVPATDFYAARGSRTARREVSSVAGRHLSNGGHFDFNDNQQPNPWHNAESSRKHTPEPSRHFEHGAKPEARIEVAFTLFCHHNR